jgi:hypothetical protein
MTGSVDDEKRRWLKTFGEPGDGTLFTESRKSPCRAGASPLFEKSLLSRKTFTTLAVYKWYGAGKVSYVMSYPQTPSCVATVYKR